MKNLIFVGDYSPAKQILLPKLSEEALFIGNLECAFSDQRRSSHKAFSSILSSEAVSTVKESGFAALSVANNHTYDAGPEAFDLAVNQISENSRVRIYGLSSQPFAVIECGCRSVAIIGCLEPCRSRGPRLFRQEDVSQLIQAIRPDFDYIFVTPHWGKESEYAFHPSPKQRKLANEWAKCGADGIFGHHSHTVQGFEKIQGKPVFYSLGNFYFPHEQGREFALTTYGLAVEYDLGHSNFSNHFVHFSFNGQLQIVNRNQKHLLNKWQNRISRDFCDRGSSWSYSKWAQTVGPVYIPKSNRSWRLRQQKSYWKATLLKIAWAALPINILLRWGARKRIASYVAEASELETQLNSFGLDRPESYSARG